MHLQRVEARAPLSKHINGDPYGVRALATALVRSDEDYLRQSRAVSKGYGVVSGNKGSRRCVACEAGFKMCKVYRFSRIAPTGLGRMDQTKQKQPR
ncbi:MAG: hypothetical protein AMXMBFR82_53340 [Candidatus Hydrogenedentota bacterium]